MYLVKREIMATSITKAMKLPGKIYSIELADERSYVPEEDKNKIKGFITNKKLT